MTDRVIEIASPASLGVRLDQLVIARQDAGEVTAPLADLAVLLLAHPQVKLTQAVLSRIAEAGGTVITCDEKFLPAAQMLPLQAHFVQTERFGWQLAMGAPLRKQLWRALVQAKVRAQGNLLKALHGDDAGLASLSSRVRSGDPDNVESQAARRYWPRVFSDPHFRRGGLGLDQNRHLDYGYAVLRAAVSRALCAAGLHPSIGVHHQNRYDVFSLASDVMEPFRPLVDRRVYEWIQEHDRAAELDRETRGWLLGLLHARYLVEGEMRTLFDILNQTADALARTMGGRERSFRPPEELEPCGG